MFPLEIPPRLRETLFCNLGAPLDDLEAPLGLLWNTFGTPLERLWNALGRLGPRPSARNYINKLPINRTADVTCIRLVI